MVERNPGLPPERRIEFRIGIHVGDAVAESDGDLTGDGINDSGGDVVLGAVRLRSDKHAHKSMAGRCLQQSPSISQLTYLPDRLLSKCGGRVA